MKLIKALFSEHGSVSMMRLMALLCCLNAVAISIIGLNKAQVDYSGISLLCGTFLGIAFGGKLMQKRTEVDGAKSESEVDAKKL